MFSFIAIPSQHHLAFIQFGNGHQTIIELLIILMLLFSERYLLCEEQARNLRQVI